MLEKKKSLLGISSFLVLNRICNYEELILLKHVITSARDFNSHLISYDFRKTPLQLGLQGL